MLTFQVIRSYLKDDSCRIFICPELVWDNAPYPQNLHLRMISQQRGDQHFFDEFASIVSRNFIRKL